MPILFPDPPGNLPNEIRATHSSRWETTSGNLWADATRLACIACVLPIPLRQNNQSAYWKQVSLDRRSSP
jgi:hypothetical protein